MFDTLTLTYRELLLGLVLASVIYLLEALLFSRRRKKTQVMRPLTADNVRLQALEREIGVLKIRLDALESVPQRTAEDSELDRDANIHIEAVRLARQGLTSSEITARVGIARAEADLIVALHKAEAGE